MKKNLIIHHKPKTKGASLVAGFAGWPNAAEVSTGCVEFLRGALGAEKFAEIEPWEFYDFASSRPLGAIDNGLVKRVNFAVSEFSFWRNEEGKQDLIILLGVEPQLRWEKYTKAILEIAEGFGVKRVYTIGGAYAKVPHTREMILGVVNNPELRDELRQNDIEFINYQGPTSFSTTLLFSLRKKNIEGIGLWGYAPHYIPGGNPSVWYSVLRRLSRMLGIALDLKELKKTGKALYQEVEKSIGQNPKVLDYIRQLEIEFDLAQHREPIKPEEVIREVEDLFKKRRGDGGFLHGG